MGAVLVIVEFRDRLIREGFSQLLDNPGARGMTRHVAVENAPSVVADDEETVEEAKVAVGTVKKSMAAIASRWLQRKEPVSHPFWISGRSHLGNVALTCLVLVWVIKLL